MSLSQLLPLSPFEHLPATLEWLFRVSLQKQQHLQHCSATVGGATKGGAKMGGCNAAHNSTLQAWTDDDAPMAMFFSNITASNVAAMHCTLQ